MTVSEVQDFRAFVMFQFRVRLLGSIQLGSGFVFGYAGAGLRAEALSKCFGGI